jgi:predicted RNA-binding Zn-ribbon protein involved in translation (DUF1610 family)
VRSLAGWTELVSSKEVNMADKIKCPDCGEELSEVRIERFSFKTFRIDYENKKLVPVYPDQPWEVDDHAIHCPNCDTLNTDDIFCQYSREEE